MWNAIHIHILFKSLHSRRNFFLVYTCLYLSQSITVIVNFINFFSVDVLNKYPKAGVLGYLLRNEKNN